MKLLLAAAALLATSPAFAQAPQRVANAIVYGNDPCPKGGDGEVVVCARRPERERYRIPKELRHENEPLTEQSWTTRTRALDEAARASRPNGCSTVGTYGQTGCFAQMLRQWFAERSAGR